MLHMERAAMLQTRSVAGQLITETQVIIGDCPAHTFHFAGNSYLLQYSSSPSASLFNHHKRIAPELTALGGFDRSASYISCIAAYSTPNSTCTISQGVAGSDLSKLSTLPLELAAQISQ